MKKRLSVIITLVLVISMLCTTTLSVFASLAETNGLGIVDNKDYYIYVGESPYWSQKHFMSLELGMTGRGVITENNVQTLGNSYGWKVDKQSDGTFRIKSLVGSNSYLSLINSPILTTDSYEFDDYINFEIIRIDDTVYNQFFSSSDNENLKGKYLIKNDVNYLTMGTTYVETTTTPTEFSCWSFVAIAKGQAEYYGYQIDDINTTVHGMRLSNAYNVMGYYDEYYNNYQNVFEICERMKTNDITIIASDGEAGAVIIDPDSLDSCGKISADYHLSEYDIQAYIGDLPANSLANPRCIIYLSSNSGEDALGNDGEYYNLVEETYKKGAHYVLGFKNDLNNIIIDEWLDWFLDNVADGTTINDAVAQANKETFNLNNGEDLLYNEYVYFQGDGTQHLDF